MVRTSGGLTDSWLSCVFTYATGAETAKADSPQLAHRASGMTVALTSQGGNVLHGLRAARDL